MTSAAKVTNKGQITVPKSVRESMNLQSGDKIVFVLRDDHVYIERLPASLEPGASYGALHRTDQPPADTEKVRGEIRKARVERYRPPENVS